jgi:hypothetical protein
VNLVCFVDDEYPKMEYENVGFGLVRMKNGVDLLFYIEIIIDTDKYGKQSILRYMRI